MDGWDGMGLLSLNSLAIRAPLARCRFAKCHGYDGYIQVKIFAGCGKQFGITHNLAKSSLFWEDLNNLCKISMYKLA